MTDNLSNCVTRYWR